MNLPVWAQRLQTVPAPVRRESALPNIYDLIVFLAHAALFVVPAEGTESMRAPISALDTSRISLDAHNPPEYALASLLFTFLVGTLAAKSRKAALLIIPTLDILQSVPVSGFLTFSAATA